MFSLCKVICRISVELDISDWNERVVRMWPDLSNIENIKSVFFSILLRHSLNEPIPFREVTFADFRVKIMSAPFRVFNTLNLSLFCSKVFYTLGSLIMIFHIVNFIFGVHPFKGVGRISVHVSITIRSSTVAH